MYLMQLLNCGFASSFHNRNLIVGQTVERIYERGDISVVGKCSRKLLQQRLLESQNRINEFKFAVVINKNIVAVLPDISNSYIIIPKIISPFWMQAELLKIVSDLAVIWPRIGTDRLLPEDNASLVIILCNAKKLKPTVREKNIMYYMLKQHILRRMLLEVQLGEWVFDLVIDLLFLNQPHFTFASSYSVSRTRDIRHLDKASRLLCRRNQRDALLAYLIRRQRPSISASFIGACSRKHSNTADIRYGSLADGRDRMNDSTLSSTPSRYRFLSSSGMITSFEKARYCVQDFHLSTTHPFFSQHTISAHL